MFPIVFLMSTYFLKSFFFFLSWPVRRAHASGLAAVIVMAPRQIKEDAAVFDESSMCGQTVACFTVKS